MGPNFDERRYLIPFRAILLPQIFTDVLVIGGGVAGLRSALTAAEASDVICLMKAEADRSNTAWAQGGIAAPIATGDTLESHLEDTLVAGAGLCERDVARRIISEGPARIRELVDMGMPFDRGVDRELLFGREAAHSVNRILHAHGDATGAALSETLLAACRAHERVRLFEHCFALDLVTDDGGGRCLGAITHHPKYGLQMIWSRVTILATGGCGQVYRETTNAPVATGDGIAMAYRAGAEIADLEFMQFHPTTLYIAGAARALISEAVRGEGAILVDREGRRFMREIHELAELAPRDVVSRAIHRLLAQRQDSCVYLDARHLPEGLDFRTRFPGITELLERFEIDPASDLIPIRPAAHYMIGGVLTDDRARTSIPGLLACGEVSCTGLHGANRLASNSLLEGLVMGHVAGLESRDAQSDNGVAPLRIVADIRPSDRSELDTADVLSSLRSVLWRHVGIEREGPRLAEVAEMFEFWARYTMDKIFDDRVGWEVQNELTVGTAILRGARWRQESRGTHFRADFPETSDAFAVHAVWRKGSSDPRIAKIGELEPMRL